VRERTIRRIRPAIFLVGLCLLAATIGLGLPSAGAQAGVVFEDGFETGNLSSWTKVLGLTVQTNEVFSGGWAARSVSTSGRSFAWERLSPGQAELDIQVRFRVQSGPKGNQFFKLRASPSPLLLLGTNAKGRLYTRNLVTRVKTTSTVVVSAGGWHLLEVTAKTGSGGRVDVSLDGAAVGILSQAQNLGTAPIGRIDLGDPRKNATFDVALDDLQVVTPDAPPPAEDVTIAVAGDIACDPADSEFNGGLGTANRCAQMRTSDLLFGRDLDAILMLGDGQYECGGYQAYLASFDPSWGRFKPLIHPAAGNHEYNASGGTDCDATRTAAGYFHYFGAAAGEQGKGYYSFDLGAWHLVALNSNCSLVGGCGKTSAQGQWFTADLAAHPSGCTLAFDHHPRWSDGEHGDTSGVSSLYETLYDAGGELFLSGHDHAYQRFTPLDPDKAPDATGVRQFVAGTGGGSHYQTIPGPTSEVAIDDEFGVLFLTLQDGGYRWSFESESGQILDSGSAPCH
jgi:Calcineurin-like phosphoesterase